MAQVIQTVSGKYTLLSKGEAGTAGEPIQFVSPQKAKEFFKDVANCPTARATLARFAANSAKVNVSDDELAGHLAQRVFAGELRVLKGAAVPKSAPMATGKAKPPTQVGASPARSGVYTSK